MSTDTYDIIIVGGGTAGLVLANRLSEDPSLQVAVLESGNDRAGDNNTLIPGAWPLLATMPGEWNFQTLPQTEIKRQVTIPQGKALGGSSAINSFLFNSTSKATIEAWQRLGNEGWDYAAYEKALNKSYTLHGPLDKTQGDGPLQLTLGTLDEDDSRTRWKKAWIDGLESLGFAQTNPLSGILGGPNICPETINPKTKQRSYAANAYLDPVRGRANLTVSTETTVAKILLERPSPGSDAVAKGVQYTSKSGQVHTIYSRREVILSAGAINSPRLLELSGIGGAALLQGLGIPVIVDNPHVGENLQNHVYTGLSFEVRDDADTLDDFFRQEPAAAAAAMKAYTTTGTGPLSTSNLSIMAQLPLPDFHSAAGREDLERLLSSSNEADSDSPPLTPAFASARNDLIRTILTSKQAGVGNYNFGTAYGPFDAPDMNMAYRAPGKHVSVAIQLSHPLSRGSVHITASSSSLPDSTGSDGVRIACRYLTHPLDLEVLARQVRFTEAVMTRAAPIASHLKPYTKRFDSGSSDSESGDGDRGLQAARDYVRRTADGAHHYVGTCAMMRRDWGGVVDSRLRVYGCRRLRVVDASVLPTTTTGNTQAGVYAVAEMAAGFVKGDLEGEGGLSW